jgi:hypothetical protein
LTQLRKIISSQLLDSLCRAARYQQSCGIPAPAAFDFSLSEFPTS